MYRAALLVIAYVLLPALLVLPGWAALVQSNAPPDAVTRARHNLEVYALACPILAIAGIALSVLFRRQVFTARWAPLVIGACAGSIAAVVTHMGIPGPVVNPPPLYLALPSIGLACGAVFAVLNQKLRQRRGEVPPITYAFRRVDVQAQPVWFRPLARWENATREANPKRLHPRYQHVHTVVTMAFILLFLGGLSLTLRATNHVMGTNVFDGAKDGPVVHQLLGLVAILLLLGALLWASWFAVASLGIWIGRRAGLLPQGAYAGYVRAGKFPIHWIRDECR